MRAKNASRTRRPRTLGELRSWVRQQFSLSKTDEVELFQGFEEVLERQRQLWQQSKEDAIRALAQGFAAKAAQLHQEVIDREIRVSNISRYFEDVVADLSEKANRDPKTKLMNFDWFMKRLESFLGVEQRGRWCAVGVVDVRKFKWYNDNLGHPIGDRIIECVADILAEQIRSEDLLATDRPAERRPRRVNAKDLHARFGGDEFCFFIPDLPGCDAALHVADRFKSGVEHYAWSGEHPQLAQHPVRVDVGMACLRLGPLAERRGVAKKIAGDLIRLADTLMYDAKSKQAGRVHPIALQIQNGELSELRAGSFES